MGASKHDDGKPRMSLIPYLPMEEVAHVLTHGAVVHDDHNWRKGFKASRLIDAAMRHIGKWCNVDHADEETGRSHLAHAICELMFALEQEILGTGEDDSWVAKRNDGEGVWHVNDIDVESREINMRQLPDGWSVNKDECYELARNGKTVARVARHVSAVNVWQWWVKGLGLSAAYGSPGEAMADAVKRVDDLESRESIGKITL